MRILFLISIVAFGLMFCHVGAGEIDEINQNNWANFKEKYGENWKVSWNNVTGTPSIIYGSVYSLNQGEVTNNEGAERLAKFFIAENYNLLKVDILSNLELSNVDKGNEEWYVSYQQQYKSIPVHNGRVSVTISDKGEIKSLGSDFYPNIDVDAIPKLSKNDALKIAKRDVIYSTEDDEIVLTIFPEMKNETLNYHLTWIVPLTSENPLWGKMFFVDAIDGEIVHQSDIFISNGKNIWDNWSDCISNSVIFAFLFLIIIIFVILFILRRNLK